MNDRPASQKRPTGRPSAPFKWNKGPPGDAQVTIKWGPDQGKQGVVKRYGFGQNEDQMVYMINLTTGGNVVVWAVNVALVVAEEPGACTASLPAHLGPPAVPKIAPTAPGSSTNVLRGPASADSGAWWCMVVYGGVSLC